MASTKSAATLDRETSQRINERATKAELVRLLAEARKERDFFKENSLRKEGVIQMLQKKVARLEGELGRQARPPVDTKRSFRERCQAYFEATGERSVTAPQLIAWEQAQAQA
jgi:hypothetical protein